MKKIYAVLLLIALIVLASCKTFWNYDSHISYYLIEDKRSLGSYGDFEKLKYSTNDSFLVSSWFHHDKVKDRTVLEAQVQIPIRLERQLEEKNITFVSSNLGGLVFDKFSQRGDYNTYRYVIVLNEINRKELMNCIAKDTLQLRIGVETYLFLSERNKIIE